MSSKVSKEMLKGLEPIGSMTDSRLTELADLCHIENVPKGSDLFRNHGLAGQSVYLVSGTLTLSKSNGSSDRVSSGEQRAKRPLGRRGAEFESATAETDVWLIRIDEDLLDIMATWDQLASVEPTQPRDPKEASGSN